MNSDPGPLAGPSAFEEVVIAGAGPIGLACALSARKRGIDPLILDAGSVVDSIRRYPIGMTFFTTPELLEIGSFPFACSGAKPTREEALKYYRGVVRSQDLRVRTFTRLAGASPRDGGLLCALETPAGSETVRCRRLVLATGYFNQPNRLCVPGEDLPGVSHYYDEGHASYLQDVVVVGGGNSAVEAALDLYRCGARVTIVHRRDRVKETVKYWIRPDLENRIREGSIRERPLSEVVEIRPGTVRIRARGAAAEETLAYRRLYVLIGFHPDFDLFRRLGIALDAEDRPEVDPATLETNVPGLSMAGSIVHGRKVSQVFIENGRFDGEKIFG